MRVTMHSTTPQHPWYDDAARLCAVSFPQLAEVGVEQLPEDRREMFGEGVQPAGRLGAESGLHRPAFPANGSS